MERCSLKRPLGKMYRLQPSGASGRKMRKSATIWDSEIRAGVKWSYANSSGWSFKFTVPRNSRNLRRATNSDNGTNARWETESGTKDSGKRNVICYVPPAQSLRKALKEMGRL